MQAGLALLLLPLLLLLLAVVEGCWGCWGCCLSGLLSSACSSCCSPAEAQVLPSLWLWLDCLSCASSQAASLTAAEG